MVESKDNQHLWFCRSWILTHTYIWSCKNEPRPTAMRFVEKMEGIWGTQWTCPTINEDGSKDFSIRPSQTLPASPAHWFYAQQKITKVYSTNVALSSNMSLEHSPHLRRRRLSMIIHLLGFIFRFNDHIYISQPTPPWLLHSVPAPTTTNHHQPPTSICLDHPLCRAALRRPHAEARVNPGWRVPPLGMTDSQQTHTCRNDEGTLAG